MVPSSSLGCPAIREIWTEKNKNLMKKLIRYFGEVKAELKKATWPWDPKEKGFKKYKQLIDSTIVVMIAMVLLGAYVATIDFAMRQFMDFLTTGF